MANTGADGLGVDWTVSLADAKSLTQNKTALQGNLDPSILYAQPTQIELEVKRTLESYGQQPGHIFNLGHGITPGVNPENVKVLVDAVHRMSAR